MNSQIRRQKNLSISKCTAYNHLIPSIHPHLYLEVSIKSIWNVVIQRIIQMDQRLLCQNHERWFMKTSRYNVTLWKSYECEKAKKLITAIETSEGRVIYWKYESIICVVSILRHRDVSYIWWEFRILANLLFKVFQLIFFLHKFEIKARSPANFGNRDFHIREMMHAKKLLWDTDSEAEGAFTSDQCWCFLSQHSDFF